LTSRPKVGVARRPHGPDSLRVRVVRRRTVPAAWTDAGSATVLASPSPRMGPLSVVCAAALRCGGGGNANRDGDASSYDRRREPPGNERSLYGCCRSRPGTAYRRHELRPLFGRTRTWYARVRLTSPGDGRFSCCLGLAFSYTGGGTSDLVRCGWSVEGGRSDRDEFGALPAYFRNTEPSTALIRLLPCMPSAMLVVRSTWRLF
jgi:hypothetical protein